MRVRYSTKHTISLALLSLLLCSFLFPIIHASTTETRYFTSTSETYKGIIVKKLLTSNTASSLSASIAYGRRFGVRVWKTNTSETETEITSGTPVATVIHPGTSEDDGEHSATWACPETVLASTDRIVVRVYSSKVTPLSWQLLQTFITEQLGASKIDSATWTVHYCLYISGTAVLFNYGSSTYPSRITNFVWTAAITGEWHDVSSWTASLNTRMWSTETSFSFSLLTRQYISVASLLFDFETRIWADAATWTYNLVTMAWQNISWTFYLGTSIWKDIAIWGASLVTMMWNEIAIYSLNLPTMAWHDLTWLFYLSPPQWVNVAVWIFSLRPAEWMLVALWNFGLGLGETLQNAKIFVVATFIMAILIGIPLLVLIMSRKRS